MRVDRRPCDCWWERAGLTKMLRILFEGRIAERTKTSRVLPIRSLCRGPALEPSQASRKFYSLPMNGAIFARYGISGARYVPGQLWNGLRQCADALPGGREPFPFLADVGSLKGFGGSTPVGAWENEA